ncbi:hypothetical protein MLD38_008565 [Melastoma candidum]|uniref:Uncharacterized protein n=1 Tax=Melastoma candidum TaxID=119954 RepID=A0ACB9RVA1_9MYRT|nr:hypothetical protein MLD38_008565 [Melastoma candidum]
MEDCLMSHTQDPTMTKAGSAAADNDHVHVLAPPEMRTRVRASLPCGDSGHVSRPPGAPAERVKDLEGGGRGCVTASFGDLNIPIEDLPGSRQESYLLEEKITRVNLWAIGKPNAIRWNRSVSFDSSEVLVAAGAASGTIKLWDLEEAKSICSHPHWATDPIVYLWTSIPSANFSHPDLLDTNLKNLGHQEEGLLPHVQRPHSRVNAIRFYPDGRWVVSGGEDNTVKLWDLTAGKLLYDFKCMKVKVHCIDFHPHEFLLATDYRSVRCLTFNPDGRALLCGLHESLRVLTWEPIRVP